jgi:hypothetical protein
MQSYYNYRNVRQEDLVEDFVVAHFEVASEIPAACRHILIRTIPQHPTSQFDGQKTPFPAMIWFV